MTFDMSAFQQEHSGEQLFGAPPGYVGHDNGSPLVDRLRERPFSVIVFDEIEKAHPNNWLRLMAAIDEGRVTDTRQVQASLENAIVIFTSNIGGDVLLRKARQNEMTAGEVAQTTIDLVEVHLSQAWYEVEVEDGKVETREGLGKPEVWGRLSGSVVAFDLLRPSAVERIVGRFCNTLAESARRARDIELKVDVPSISRAIEHELGAPGTWNGRQIKGYLDRLVRRPLAKALTTEVFAEAKAITTSIDGSGRLLLSPR
jgi:ATP-dependent Clp protease ATP-binding subunit ClpA